MTAAPLVSVLVPTYNGRRFIAESLESALAQTMTSFEVIVVDDGSTDDTAEIVARYPVRYVRQANAGTAAARNRGLREASGRYVALLDHDDLWEPAKLEQQVDCFEDDGVGLVHTAAQYFLSDTGRVTSEAFVGEQADFHSILGMQTLTAATMTFSKAALEAVGGFDETLVGTDDWDVSLRVAHRYRVVGIPTVLARIRAHEHNQGKNALLMYRNAMKVIAKNEALHGNCPACRRAVGQAHQVWRAAVYVGLAGESRRLWNEGRYAAAVCKRVQGLAMNPAALWNALARLRSRAGHPRP